jgi:hypothetical protein
MNGPKPVYGEDEYLEELKSRLAELGFIGNCVSVNYEYLVERLYTVLMESSIPHEEVDWVLLKTLVADAAAWVERELKGLSDTLEVNFRAEIARHCFLDRFESER